MSDMADMLTDDEMHAWDMHVLGLCEDYCHYCAHEYQREQKLLAEMHDLDEQA